MQAFDRLVLYSAENFDCPMRESNPLRSMRIAGRADDPAAGGVETVLTATAYRGVTLGTRRKVWPITKMRIQSDQSHTQHRQGGLLPVKIVQGP